MHRDWLSGLDDWITGAFSKRRKVVARCPYCDYRWTTCYVEELGTAWLDDPVCPECKKESLDADFETYVPEPD